MSDPRRTTVLLLDRTGAAAPSLRAWQDQLAASAPNASVVTCSPQELADDPDVAGGLADDALVVVAESGTVPSPHLVAHLVAARDRVGEDTMVDSVVLPLPTGSGACVLLDVRSLRRVADAWREPGTRAERLAELAGAAGLEVVLDRSCAVFLGDRAPDSAAPTSHPATGSLHPAALEATALAELLRATGVAPDPAGLAPDPGGRPFLSVLVRTQGRRPQCLAEALTCLAAQTDRDLELLLVCHRTGPERVAETRALVDALPGWLRERTRVLESERPGRAAPLNDALEVARGRYAVVLDDDDLVLEHWVETFHRLEERAPGRVLRATALQQPVEASGDDGDLVAVPTGPARPEWPPTFELVDHLIANHSPCLTVAFPRGVFADLGLRYDETLATTEDWDYLVRAAGVVGVESDPEVTGVYRWWAERGSSREAHGPQEWEEARQRVLAGFDRRPMLLPPGAAERLRTLLDEAAEEARAAHALAERLATSQHEVIARLDEVVAAHDAAVRGRDRAVQERERAARDLAAAEEKLRRRRERQRERTELVREADELLAGRPRLRPAAPLVDLSVAELRELVRRLRTGPGRRPWGRPRS